MVLLMKKIVKRKILLIFKNAFIFVAKDSKIHLQNYKILIKSPFNKSILFQYQPNPFSFWRVLQQKNKEMLLKKLLKEPDIESK